MASICLSAAEEEQKQMRDGSADPHGDVPDGSELFALTKPVSDAGILGLSSSRERRLEEDLLLSLLMVD